MLIFIHTYAYIYINNVKCVEKKTRHHQEIKKKNKNIVSLTKCMSSYKTFVIC